jgi:hypothetical protein
MSNSKISRVGVQLLLEFLPVFFGQTHEATAKSKAPAALVEVEGNLVDFEEGSLSCTYQPGASTHGMFESPPLARFELTSPKAYVGRTLYVLLRCDKARGLHSTLKSGKDRLFRLVLPRALLEGSSARIEECNVGAATMNRWRLKPRVGGSRDGALTGKAAHKAVARTPG